MGRHISGDEVKGHWNPTLMLAPSHDTVLKCLRWGFRNSTTVTKGCLFIVHVISSLMQLMVNKVERHI